MTRIAMDNPTTGCIGILFVVLSMSKSYRVHVAGAVAVWLTVVSRAILQAL